MLRKMCMNVVFLCCVALVSAFVAVNCPPLAGAQGVDSYTKLMLHIENNVTDSAAGKTVTNNNVASAGSVL